MTLPDHDDRHAALTDFQNNLVITAGAGTGKTSLLVGRLVAALVQHHMEPHQVLAVTFTDNAASEMRERLIRVLHAVRPWLEGDATRVEPSDAYVLEQIGLGPESLSRVDHLLDQVEALSISTFHGFCLNFLRDHARELNLPPDLGVGDSDGNHPGFDEVFLACLLKATGDAVHPALTRFDATELKDLAEQCIELPDDSLERTANLAPPDDLHSRREALEQLLREYPKARKPWRERGEALVRCYRDLESGIQPDFPDIQKKSPVAGKRELGDASDEVTGRLEEHRKFLKPFVESDQQGIALAIDFVKPVLESYRQHVASRGELGFQDLLLQTRKHLRDRPNLRRQMARRLKAILVDEFQDTDPLQYDVVFLLAAEPPDDNPEPVHDPMELTLRRGSLFIVGDAKQSIYRFRRADVAAFTRAVDCIARQGGRKLALSANFRSRAKILEFVNEVCAVSLAEDRPYQFGYAPVVPMQPGGEAPTLLEVDSDTKLRSHQRRIAEGDIVVREIQALHEAGTDYGSIAVLLRAMTDTSWILRPLRAANIPYVLEGSRRFYQRQEIVLCGALLSAMARPHDPVAVLAILRSSLSTATDPQISDFLAAEGSLNFRIPADPGPGAEGDPVRECLRFLADLHAEVRGLPIDQALTQILTLPELRLAEGCGFEGAQRLANVERLLHKLLHRRPLDLADAASQVAQNTDVESDDEESPLFDRGVDAVRVLTVHRAKGLEFPVVFVPDLARSHNHRDRVGLAQAQRLFDGDGREIVTVRIGNTRNVASLLHQQAGRNHDAAEQRRLFYVAATRAKEKLFLIRSESSATTKAPWQDDLEPGLDRVSHRRAAPAARPAPGAADATFDPGPTLAAHAAFLELRERRRIDDRTEEAPSRRVHRAESPQPTADQADATPRQLTFPFAPAPAESASRPGSRAARPTPTAQPRTPAADAQDPLAIGNAAHAYFALVDLRHAEIDAALLADLAPWDEEVRAMATRFLGSPLQQRLRRSRALHREIPLAYAESDSSVHGIIDLLIEEEDGSFTVLDWKTDAVTEDEVEARAATYGPQLASYATGVQRALELPAPPRTEVHFLRCGRTVVLQEA